MRTRRLAARRAGARRPFAAGFCVPVAALGAGAALEAWALSAPAGRRAPPSPRRPVAARGFSGQLARALSTSGRGIGEARSSTSRLRAAVELADAGEEVEAERGAADAAEPADAGEKVQAERGGAVDTGAVLTALRGVFLPLNTRKSAWRMPGFECRGFTLGLSLGYGRGLAVPTAATRNWPELATVLCAACREADPEFRFTSIQVNLNTKYLMHTDGIDAGPSRMIACGNFTRGRMWLHNSTGESWSAIDVKDRWVAFDGREFHLTEEWDGPERWSLVYFTNPTYRRARKSKKGRDTMMHLMQLGFPWPRPDDLFEYRLQKEAERREAAARILPPELQDAVVRRPASKSKWSRPALPDSPS